MNRTTKFGKIFLAVFVLGMGLILCPGNTAAFSLTSSDTDQIVHSETNFTLNALVMKVNLQKAYFVIAEKHIYLMDFKAGDKHYRTAFVNERGDISYAASVKASQWEGKRVLVKGYRLNSGNIVAKSIERLTDSPK
jgi:hypothetical protein